MADASTDVQDYMRAVADAMDAGDIPRAFRTGSEAVANGAANAQLLTLAAYDQMNLGNDRLALEYAQRARDEMPRSIDTLTVLAISLQRNEKRYDAIKIYDTVLRDAPHSVPHRFNKACLLEDLEDVTRAVREFERLLEADPNHVESLTRLATLAVQRGDNEAARGYAQRVKKIDAGSVPATLALATADLQDGKYEDALRQLAACPPGSSFVNLAIAQGIMGDALDGLGRYADAFTAYGISNTTLRDFYRPIYEIDGVESAYARAARLARYFTGGGKWAKENFSPRSPVGTHVFLLGFPRSGTTLLDQVLAAHPDIEVMEERDCLADAAKAFVVPQDGIEKLSVLGAEDLQFYRDSYWRQAQEGGALLEKRVFVDKMPLNSVLLPLITKFFPNAKILFAGRDPRDVVLSCFRRRFGMSPQMYELTSLDTAAHYYDAVMRLVTVYREKLDLDIRDVRYESLVADFENTTRGICDFLGVRWDDSMRDFAQGARSKNIGTPSAAQVARGLYTEGVGQWQHYAAQLAPIMPVLTPWLANFGY